MLYLGFSFFLSLFLSLSASQTLRQCVYFHLASVASLLFYCLLSRCCFYHLFVRLKYRPDSAGFLRSFRFDSKPPDSETRSITMRKRVAVMMMMITKTTIMMMMVTVTMMNRSGSSAMLDTTSDGSS